MNAYTDFLEMLSGEFHKYIMENSHLEDKISGNTMIIFQVEGENEFNNWHKKLSLKNSEKGQPIIYVNIKKWRKHSLIEDINIKKITA